MRVAVFGLGYVGSVSAACLAAAGHEVLGVDVNRDKVDAVNAGRSPVSEPGLAELIARLTREGRLRAHHEGRAAVEWAEVSLICVGTPSLPSGDVDVSFVRRAVVDVGAGLARTERGHLVVVRSTLLPGSTEEVVIPALEMSAPLIEGTDFDVVYNPEFLREGCGIEDFHAPTRTVIGHRRPEAADRAAKLYATVKAPVVRTNVRTAEMVKYADNAFHGLKVAFANEIAALARAHGLDGDEIMRIFRMDTRLNLSAAYLRPGNAFGGSCLPKDLRALTRLSGKSGIDTPVLEAALHSNASHKRRAEDLIVATGARTVAVLGLSFKSGTDDMRESPAVELATALLRRGLDVRVFDPQVCLEALIGANRRQVEMQIPRVSEVLKTRLAEALEGAQAVVLTRADPVFFGAAASLGAEVTLVDLAVAIADPTVLGCRYLGLAR